MSKTLKDHLRKITQEALSAAEDDDATSEAERREAEALIEEILPRAEAEARKGNDFLVVMTVTFKGKPRLFESQPLALPTTTLIGSSSIVYDFCKRENLNPTLVGRWEEVSESVHRIEFSLIIHW